MRLFGKSEYDRQQATYKTGESPASLLRILVLEVQDSGQVVDRRICISLRQRRQTETVFDEFEN